MTTVLPGPHQRWRCSGCGNLTRFDVARTRRTTEYWHFDLAGEHEVEATEVRAEAVESAVKAVRNLSALRRSGTCGWSSGSTASCISGSASMLCASNG